MGVTYGVPPTPATVYHPLASGDDGAALTALLARGQAVDVAPGSTLNVTSSITFPATGGVLHFGEGTNVAGNVPGGAIILADVITGRTNPPGGAVTTSADATVGAVSMTVSALHGLVAGNAIVLVRADGTEYETHTIRSVSGTTVNLREPIERTFVSGTTVALLAGIPRVRITGDQGSTISGTAAFGIQLMGVIAYVNGLTIAGAWVSTGAGSWAVCADWSVRDGEFSDLHVVADGTNPGQFALCMESNINCFARRVTVDQTAAQFTAAAFEINSPIRCGLEFCQAPRSAVGLLGAVSGNGLGTLDTYGARGLTVLECGFPDSGNGIILNNAGSHYEIVNCSMPRCTSAGIVVEATGGGAFPSGVVVDGGDFTACALGLQVVGGDVQIKGADFTDSGKTSYQVLSSGSTAKVTVDACTFGWSADSGSNTGTVVGETGGGLVTVHDARPVIPASPAGDYYTLQATNASGVIRLRDVRVVAGVTGAGGGFSVGLDASAAATIFDLGECDFSLTSFPYDFLGTSLRNWGSFVANGATGVSVTKVASPGAQAGFSFWMVTPGGTVGTPSASTALSAGAVSFKSLASDTSTYGWALRE